MILTFDMVLGLKGTQANWGLNGTGWFSWLKGTQAKNK